uniref:Uncharacterized protein n=1 Tax=uncultured marine virus TaxID=186617 RepID=A0A0F7L439_9VIRU|nr:hypothetical protein [uncultured marine virus]
MAIAETVQLVIAVGSDGVLVAAAVPLYWLKLGFESRRRLSFADTALMFAFAPLPVTSTKSRPGLAPRNWNVSWCLTAPLF